MIESGSEARKKRVLSAYNWSHALSTLPNHQPQSPLKQTTTTWHEYGDLLFSLCHACHSRYSVILLKYWLLRRSVSLRICMLMTKYGFSKLLCPNFNVYYLDDSDLSSRRRRQPRHRFLGWFSNFQPVVLLTSLCS